MYEVNKDLEGFQNLQGLFSLLLLLNLEGLRRPSRFSGFPPLFIIL